MQKRLGALAPMVLAVFFVDVQFRARIDGHAKVHLARGETTFA